MTKEPTKTEIDKRINKCSVCGYVTKTENIDKLEDAKKPDENPDNETSHNKLPPISKEERIVSR